jgi:membrane-bound ClpP family serine protease
MMSRPLTGRGDENDPHRVTDIDGRSVDGRSVDVEQRVVTKPARTSTAAAFALAIGVAALVCVLIVILSPVGLVLGIIGLILGILGLRASRKVGITGKGVAIAGTVLSALAIVISIAFAAGMVTVLNNDSAVERIEQELDKMRDKLPDSVEVPQP